VPPVSIVTPAGRVTSPAPSSTVICRQRCARSGRAGARVWRHASASASDADSGVERPRVAARSRCALSVGSTRPPLRSAARSRPALRLGAARRRDPRARIRVERGEIAVARKRDSRAAKSSTNARSRHAASRGRSLRSSGEPITRRTSPSHRVKGRVVLDAHASPATPDVRAVTRAGGVDAASRADTSAAIRLTGDHSDPVHGFFDQVPPLCHRRAGSRSTARVRVWQRRVRRSRMLVPPSRPPAVRRSVVPAAAVTRPLHHRRSSPLPPPPLPVRRPVLSSSRRLSSYASPWSRRAASWWSSRPAW